MAIRYKKFHTSPQAVFVDLDGCLMDAGCMTTVLALQQVFQERGVTITDVEAASKPSGLVGTDVTSKKSHLRHTLFDVVPHKWKAVNGAEPTQWDLEALFKEFPRCIKDHLNRVKAVPGAADVVRSLQAEGLKVAIASTFSGEVHDHWMRVSHSQGFTFDEALGCADVQNPGREGVYNCVLPDPWRCLALAHRLGVYPLSTTIRVATTAHGIEEGLNAGMWTVAVYNTGLVSPFIHPSETDAQRKNRTCESFYRLGCHYVIDGIWDLPKTLETIRGNMERGQTP